MIVRAGEQEARTAAVQDGGRAPVWGGDSGRMEFPFDPGEMPEHLSFSIFDEETAAEAEVADDLDAMDGPPPEPDEELGYARLSLVDRHLDDREEWAREESLGIFTPDNKKTKGRLVVELRLEFDPEPSEITEGAEAELQARRLEVTVLRAENLPPCDFLGENDPFAVVAVGDVQRQTTTIEEGGADPCWQSGSGEILYFERRAPPQSLELQMWDEDADEPVNALEVVVLGGSNLPPSLAGGQAGVFVVLNVDTGGGTGEHTQRTPSLPRDETGHVQWSQELRWECASGGGLSGCGLPSQIGVALSEDGGGLATSAAEPLAVGAFEFTQPKLGRGLIAGVTPEQEFVKEMCIELRRPEGQRFKQKKQPTLRVRVRWRPQVVDNDFIGKATVALGREMPAEMDWNLERAVSIFGTKGNAAGTVHLHIRWNTNPDAEPEHSYTSTVSRWQRKLGHGISKLGAERALVASSSQEADAPAVEHTTSKVLSSGSGIPPSVAAAMREAEARRLGGPLIVFPATWPPPAISICCCHCGGGGGCGCARMLTNAGRVQSRSCPPRAACPWTSWASSSSPALPLAAAHTASAPTCSRSSRWEWRQAHKHHTPRPFVHGTARRPSRAD